MTDIAKLEAGEELDLLVTERVLGITRFYHGGHPSHYSTDISKAWEVVEKLKPMMFVLRDWKGENYEAAFFDEYEHDGEVSLLGKSMDLSEGKTAPLSICLAALKAVDRISKQR